MQYYALHNAIGNINKEYVYLLQAREGELLVISVGHGDSTAYAKPKIKRLLNTYSKIAGITWSGSTTLYVAVAAYSHECLLTQIAGNDVPNISIEQVSQATYNSGTAITIET